MSEPAAPDRDADALVPDDLADGESPTFPGEADGPGDGLPDEEFDEELDDAGTEVVPGSATAAAEVRPSPRERLRHFARRGRPAAGNDRQRVAGEASASVAHENLKAERARNAAAGRDEIPVDLTAAAFFDVDNTLVRGASIIHLARGLAKHDYFSTRDILDFGWQQLKFRVTGKENSDDVAGGREKALSFVRGREVTELEALSEEVFDERMVGRIWPGTRALAQMHLDAGQQVWLVTATPVQLAQVIADRLGLTGALGTVAEIEDGRFTGRLVGDLLHGVGKAHAVRSLAASEGLNLRRCTAYSDSSNDVPMLSLVGTAVAINPDAELREVATARGWQVRDFRTVRKAARVGVPTALAAGAIGGAVAALLSDRGLRALRRIGRSF